MLSARAAKCRLSGRGRRKGTWRSMSFAMTRSRRATSATALENVFTTWRNCSFGTGRLSGVPWARVAPDGDHARPRIRRVIPFRMVSHDRRVVQCEAVVGASRRSAAALAIRAEHGQPRDAQRIALGKHGHGIVRWRWRKLQAMHFATGQMNRHCYAVSRTDSLDSARALVYPHEPSRPADANVDVDVRLTGRSRMETPTIEPHNRAVVIDSHREQGDGPPCGVDR